MPNPKDKAAMFLDAWNFFAPLSIQAQFTPVPEYPFDRLIKRRHHFDFAFIPQKLAVEVDGGNHITRFSKKVGKAVVVGSHTGADDMTKQNLAAILGWRVMHYTPGMLRHYPELCINMVVQALLAQGDGPA